MFADIKGNHNNPLGHQPQNNKQLWGKELKLINKSSVTDCGYSKIYKQIEKDMKKTMFYLRLAKRMDHKLFVIYV